MLIVTNILLCFVEEGMIEMNLGGDDFDGEAWMGGVAPHRQEISRLKEEVEYLKEQCEQWRKLAEGHAPTDEGSEAQPLNKEVEQLRREVEVRVCACVCMHVYSTPCNKCSPI